jgi:hypothetical protein
MDQIQQRGDTAVDLLGHLPAVFFEDLDPGGDPLEVEVEGGVVAGFVLAWRGDAGGAEFDKVVCFAFYKEGHNVEEVAAEGEDVRDFCWGFFGGEGG